MSRFYDKAVWRKARRMHLNQEPLCRFCANAGLIVPATDVDHIIPISQGGAALDPENFRSLCATCHKKITARQLNRTDKPLKGCDVNGMPNDPLHPWNSK